MFSGLRIALVALLPCVSLCGPVRGEEWIIGNQEHPWGEWGGEEMRRLGTDGQDEPDRAGDRAGLGFQPTGEAIVARMDIATEPGWLKPVRVDSTTNLSFGIRARTLVTQPIQDRAITGENAYTGGGPIDAPFNLVDGDVGSYANNGGLKWQYHMTVHFDLGWPFPLNRIHWLGRPAFPLRFPHAYTVSVADGDPAFYVPIEKDGPEAKYWDQAPRNWTTVAEAPINTTNDIDIRIPTQWVRYISLGDTLVERGNKTRWEIAEVELHGDGFVPNFTYTSAIIPFESGSNWGALRWHAEADSGTTLLVRSRSGQTPDPYLYFVKTGLGPTGQTQVTRSEYRATRKDPNRKVLLGPIADDTDNWSFWSRLYTQSGQMIVSPAPARYFQFQVAFTTSDPEAGVRIDSVAIEFSSPPVAQELVGELGYDAVRPGRWEEFRYAIRARFAVDDTGFNALRIVTPDRADSTSIRDVRVNGTAVAPDSVHVAHDGFTVFLPVHVGPAMAPDGALVEMVFSARTYMHGTTLGGSVFDSNRPQALAQSIRPGDATEELDTDNLQVLWELGGSLLGSVSVAHNVFTPNGDGINDDMRIDYALFQVDRAVPVSFTVYDLTGRAVFGQSTSQSNGARTVRWDGLNDTGQLVAPGLYVWRLSADTDIEEYTETGIVAVVY